ncbi:MULTISPECIES: hypothetical protein [unclassified Nostoc]|uniref:hypothetical protein n=1 Tax=unclassified Nostoc TaxID=2593658 RepID=UPI002AD2DFCB|nr:MULTISPECIES: hypothetical protein [unclassified Nostoc]MDZ7990058.1 hypothetical protein [Nostoc sp. DedVER02]MDZ8111798.1 hypothetical protein [Nostoc sp. DedVER01b]
MRTWLEKQGVAIADSYWTIFPGLNLSNRSRGKYSSIFIAIAFISFAAFIFGFLNSAKPCFFGKYFFYITDSG